MQKSETDKRIKIPFHIHPYLFEKKQHAVEKTDEKGRKRRYLYGISSGMKLDGVGERMTGRCVKGMQTQAESGEVLLYPGPHGVDTMNDIGRLVESQITPGGDWVTTYRLYDQHDGFNPGGEKLEKANTLWKQVNGLPPYEDPKQYGFSIEGYIPAGGILEMSDTGQRVIDWVDLDGVIVTPRPAYEDSFAKAVWKALDILPPQKKVIETENIKATFLSLIQDGERERNFYNESYRLENARDEMIEKIMSRGIQVQDRLIIVFDEYRNAMIQLILEYRDVFQRPNDQSLPEKGSVDVAKMQKLRVFKTIHDQMQALLVMKQNKQRSKDRGRKRKHGPRGRRKNTG